MTVIDIIWVVTLSVAVTNAVVVMFVAWLGSSVDGGGSELWKRAVQAIVLQWVALLFQVLVLAVALSDKG